MANLLSRIAQELGLTTLLSSSPDTKLLCLSRLVRLFAYGSSTLILALYLSALGVSDSRIGLFMTLTLLGDVVISLFLTVVADRVGRRRMLALGSGLMAGSGVVFALTSNYWVMVGASVLGVISPSGNEIGPFKAVEESTIAQLVQSKDRSDILAWYTLSGSAGTAMGTIVCGWVLQALQDHGWTAVKSYRAVFWIYALLGLVKLALSMLLSARCEVEEKAAEQAKMDASATARTDDMQLEGLLADDDDEDIEAAAANTPPPSPPSSARTLQPKPRKPTLLTSLLPAISPESLRLLSTLCILFAIDSLASGLVPSSFMTYYFSTTFSLSTGFLGSLFFVTNILSAISSLLASSIARRIGLIKTMVFTHMPSSIALALIPVSSWLPLAMAFLILRSSIASMDQAPRQAFLASAVLPSERTSVMGVVNVVKTLSQSAGPVITGYLAGKGRFWVAFVVAGGMKLTYDGLLLRLFVGYRTREERAEEQTRNVKVTDGVDEENEGSART